MSTRDSWTTSWSPSPACAAAAVGVPHDHWGEAVHLFVVPQPGATLDAGDLRQKVLEELGPLYEPTGVSFVDILPWTTMGKIDKKALRATLVTVTS
jgi:fatty-acyl-CoA synthase